MRFYEPDSFEPEQAVGYLTKRVHQLGHAALEPLFSAHGLTHSQWSALVTIYYGKGRTCAGLAREMAYDAGATTRLVDAIEARGWITRRRSDDDRRVIHLALTPDGEALARLMRDRVVECWNEWLSDWDRAEADTLLRLLRKLRDRLDGAACGAAA